MKSKIIKIIFKQLANKLENPNEQTYRANCLVSKKDNTIALISSSKPNLM